MATGKKRTTKDRCDEEKTNLAWMCGGDDDWYIIKDAAAVRQEDKEDSQIGGVRTCEGQD